MAISNHIHLLVYDKGGGDVIPKTLQLVAGQTTQEYNQGKHRKGVYWEDRHHATAVQTDRHLIQNIVYVDLKMGRGWSGHASLRLAGLRLWRDPEGTRSVTVAWRKGLDGVA